MPRQRSLGYFVKGLVVNSTNPKALLFYAALFPPFVSPHDPFVPQLITLASTFLVLFVLVGMLHALIGHRLSKLLSQTKSLNITNKASGAVMIGVAAWMATK